MDPSSSRVSIEQALSIGARALREGQFARAESIFRQVLAHTRSVQVTEQAYGNLGIALANQGKLNEALANFRRAVELAPDVATTHANLANALKSTGQYAEAIASFQQALKLQPNHVDALNNLGILHLELGDIEAAVRCFEDAIHHDNGNASALFRLCTVLRDRTSQTHVAQIESLLQRDDLADEQQALLHAGLAAIADADMAYKRAAEHAARSNRHHKAFLLSRGAHYDPDAYSQYANDLMTAFNGDYFDRVRGFGLESDLPVFVFGLPRSGTTLVEQILASHPQVAGAGERLFAFESYRSLPTVTGAGNTPIESLARIDQDQIATIAQQHLDRLHQIDENADRITNKMPDNYLLMGFIVTLFPQATLIHCRRDLRDVATSCWLTNFYNVSWTNDQQHIVSHLNTFCRVMDHWRTVLPGRIHEVSYEALVTNPQPVIAQLLDACNLPWHPACREFHASGRPVHTASEVQARQPISTKSLGRHKNYESYLSEMFAALPD